MENKLLRPHPKEDVGKKKGNFIGNYVIPHILGKNKKAIDVPLITFLGAARTVTGSKYLIRYKDKKILIDCGLFQGIKDDKIKNKKELPVSPKKIDAIITVWLNHFKLGADWIIRLKFIRCLLIRKVKTSSD